MALETAVGLGSVAILKGRAIVAETDDSFSNASRAEDILTVLDNVIERAGLSLSHVGMIAVSIGPGSYSGIRIGASTALGLKNALSAGCRGVSILEAMAYGFSSGEMITAVPVGKSDVAWQRFEVAADLPDPLSDPCLTPLSELESSLEGVVLCGPRALINRIATSGQTHIADEAVTLAGLVGRYALALPEMHDRLRPVYLRSGTGF